MGRPQCKYFFGIIRQPDVASSRVERLLAREFGAIDTCSGVYPFDKTDYYMAEMGKGLVREFFSLSSPDSPGSLPDYKLRCARIEEQWKDNGNRVINIDPGYMDFYKIVLASFKEGGQKIYMSDGVYADMTLYYKKGEWHAFPWTFPDFALGVYDQYFIKLREAYKTGK